METKLVVFKTKEIRRTLHNQEWWSVIEDVVLADRFERPEAVYPAHETERHRAW